MKLVIQIPCFNEASTLALIFQDMPRSIEGISNIEYQVIDDSSTDQTTEVARSLGVDHVIRVRGRNRRWLGRAFKIGIDHALARGADIVVNTDGDNQYPSSRIPDLVRPIVDGYVDIVIGDRNPGQVKEYSRFKRFLQRLGNQIIEYLTGEPARDAVSGFRAYSRDALLRIHVMTKYTYTVDTLIQAHKKGIDIAWIDITPNKKTRESRLITSLTDKVRKSGATILRLTTVYEPFKTFAFFALVFLVPGLVLLARFLYFFFFVPGEANGHIQSVVVGSVFLVIAVQMFVLGILGDLMSINRNLVEDALTRLRRLEAGSNSTSTKKSEERPRIVNA